MARYVNIYKDDKGRFISDKDWDNRIDAMTFPMLDHCLIVETVRLLSKEEEDELEKYKLLYEMGFV
jgi:hypothetical protein